MRLKNRLLNAFMQCQLFVYFISLGTASYSTTFYFWLSNHVLTSTVVGLDNGKIITEMGYYI